MNHVSDTKKVESAFAINKIVLKDEFKTVSPYVLWKCLRNKNVQDRQGRTHVLLLSSYSSELSEDSSLEKRKPLNIKMDKEIIDLTKAQSCSLYKKKKK